MEIILYITYILLLIWLFVYMSYILSRRDAFRFRCYFYKDYYTKQLLRNELPFTTHNKRLFKNNKNIISMSIYGNNPKYYNGLKERVKEYTEILPEWKIRVYYHNLINQEYKNYLESIPIELVEVTDPLVRPGNSAGMFWRFLPLTEHTTFLVVDVDNKPIFSKKTIHQWINSPNRILKHTPKPNIWPTHYIQANSFAFKSNAQFTTHDIQHFPCRSNFGSDELFLYFVVLEKYKKDEITIYSTNTIDKLFNRFEMFTPVKKYPHITLKYIS